MFISSLTYIWKNAASAVLTLDADEVAELVTRIKVRKSIAPKLLGSFDENPGVPGRKRKKAKKMPNPESLQRQGFASILPGALFNLSLEVCWIKANKDVALGNDLGKADKDLLSISLSVYQKTWPKTQQTGLGTRTKHSAHISRSHLRKSKTHNLTVPCTSVPPAGKLALACCMKNC